MKLITLILLLGLISCTKESSIPSTPSESDPVDNLSFSGILGKWTIQSRTFDNISNGAALCCEWITFSSNADSTDLMGNFQYEGNGDSNVGVFTLDTLTNTYEVDFGSNDIRSYSYSIQDNSLSVTYTENQQTVNEVWTK